MAVKFRERVPKLAPWNGGDAWHIEGLDPVPLPITAATGSGYRLGRGSSKTPMAFHDVLPGLYEPVSRLEAQEANSIDAEVLYPSPTLWDAINQMDDPKLKVACVRAYNDWIAEFCAQDPRRLIGLGKIPSTGGEDACKELHRCVEERNLRGVVLDGWPSGKQIAGDSDDDAFWEAIDGLGVPVSLHYAIGGQRPSHPYGGIGPGLKPPMADAALPLVAGSVFDRYPNIRLVFADGDAGWVFHWLEFMDINYVRHRHLDQYALQNPDALPSEYVRKHSWFTFHHDRSAVKNRQKVGAAHLMWASHFPLDDSIGPMTGGRPCGLPRNFRARSGRHCSLPTRHACTASLATSKASKTLSSTLSNSSSISSEHIEDVSEWIDSWTREQARDRRVMLASRPCALHVPDVHCVGKWHAGTKAQIGLQKLG